MSSKQVRDILEHMRSFHHKLSEAYQEGRDESDDERVRFLLGYMGRHEENFNRVLKKYEKGASEGLLNTWIPFATDELLDEALESIDLSQNRSVGEVIQTALELDRKVLALYRQLANSSAAPHVSELFSNLLEMEESKDQQYARNMLELGNEE